MATARERPGSDRLRLDLFRNTLKESSVQLQALARCRAASKGGSRGYLNTSI